MFTFCNKLLGYIFISKPFITANQVYKKASYFQNDSQVPILTAFTRIQTLFKYSKFPSFGQHHTACVHCPADMGEINRGGLPDLDLDFSKSRGGLPDLDLDPTRFLSRYYPPRDISPISAV